MKKEVRLSPEQIEMVQVVAENNMKLAQAARVLFCSRPGLQYQLEKIHQITGLDPTNFYDLWELIKLIDDWNRPKRYRYYCIENPPAPGTLPASMAPVDRTSYGMRCYIAAIDRMAYGWVEYEHELRPPEIARYKLIMKPRECEP